jgi:hypothetical protein
MPTLGQFPEDTVLITGVKGEGKYPALPHTVPRTVADTIDAIDRAITDYETSRNTMRKPEGE